MELVNVIVLAWKLLLKKIKKNFIFGYNSDNFSCVLTQLTTQLALLICSTYIDFTE